MKKVIERLRRSCEMMYIISIAMSVMSIVQRILSIYVFKTGRIDLVPLCFGALFTGIGLGLSQALRALGIIQDQPDEKDLPLNLQQETRKLLNSSLQALLEQNKNLREENQMLRDEADNSRE